MTPAPGSRLTRFVGDRLRFVLRGKTEPGPATGWRALLRTNLGRGDVLRREIIHASAQGMPQAGAAWRDLPMIDRGESWELELSLTETGYFKAKAYWLDPRGWQHWPEGPDLGISSHPNRYRTGNTIYCAFTRLFGATRAARATADPRRDKSLAALEATGCTAIPPSGKLRDLTVQLPHIIQTLGCQILHLLPVNPTPTTYARFGPFGSPYAALDLTAIDPALVVFDKRTTGIDQFRELTYQTHLRGARVFLDIVINHTGWGSALQETHPEWFVRNADGAFASPGAWGTIWEDLIELKHDNPALWDQLAEMFLTWCRRGVDGFRCDAGYKVTAAAWQYIVARVQQEYPDTIFLLEGLGGAWETTETLLTEGGMQWAYSELFQNFSGREVATYLDHSLGASARVGLLVHYSETHDNDRLAARGRAWSLLRNRLCALASVNGAYGFTCGAEWLATQKIDVHGATGLAWGSEENLVPELALLDQLLLEHPCFFDAAKLDRLSPIDSKVYALSRESAEGKDRVLILVNTDVEREQTLELDFSAAALPISETLSQWVDLLQQKAPELKFASGGKVLLTLKPGACFCLSPAAKPQGLSGDDYRRTRARSAWALTALAQLLPSKEIPGYDWRGLAELVDQKPGHFLAAVSHLTSHFEEAETHAASLQEFGSLEALANTVSGDFLPKVITWKLTDQKRITPVPPGHWLFLQDATPFRATLDCQDNHPPQHLESVAVRDGHVGCFPPRQTFADAILTLERYAEADQQAHAQIRFLDSLPRLQSSASRAPLPDDLVLLTNGRGGMARLGVDLGRIKSKYDCVLGANLHPSLPVDRHVFAKRIRVWVNADGFISPLDFTNLAEFQPGPPAVWSFIANAGDGRTVEIDMTADMLEGLNTTAFHFSRPTASQATGKQLPAETDVRLTVRIDIEDRNFHSETHRNGGAEHHFSNHCQPLEPAPGETPEQAFSGFVFAPAPDRQLRVFADRGRYNSQPEWCENIPHPIEQTRGQVGGGDAYSPGWFELPLPKGADVTLIVTAETLAPERESMAAWRRRLLPPQASSVFPSNDLFGQQLLRAAQAFAVRRGEGKTVIAGYPWFLDWGRDTFICARGLLAAGLVEEVKQILVTFARFEKNGTLPNTIFGEDASNRDTSDAPLWFGLVCEEVAALAGNSFYQTKVGREDATIGDTLWDIALNYINGTPNGIRMDPGSALIWSPSHFTWMDTNYPACTPREGFPVEIQALWIRLLRQIERIGGRTERKGWDALHAQALASLDQLFWLEDRGYYADVRLAKSGQPASAGVADDALRSNCLFAVSLGLVNGRRAQRCVQAAGRYLVVPGALRSLAPLPVTVPLPNYGNDGRLLNDPYYPYWGRYEGDEDTRRKPAYHNGTAWTWTFPKRSSAPGTFHRRPSLPPKHT